MEQSPVRPGFCNPLNPALREVLITITYTVGPQRRTYTLRTFISSFS